MRVKFPSCSSNKGRKKEHKTKERAPETSEETERDHALGEVEKLLSNGAIGGIFISSRDPASDVLTKVVSGCLALRTGYNLKIIPDSDRYQIVVWYKHK
mgnify:CR=1 FL=1